jgi:hypothetical protein
MDTEGGWPSAFAGIGTFAGTAMRSKELSDGPLIGVGSRVCRVL